MLHSASSLLLPGRHLTFYRKPWELAYWALPRAAKLLQHKYLANTCRSFQYLFQCYVWGLRSCQGTTSNDNRHIYSSRIVSVGGERKFIHYLCRQVCNLTPTHIRSKAARIMLITLIASLQSLFTQPDTPASVALISSGFDMPTPAYTAWKCCKCGREQISNGVDDCPDCDEKRCKACTIQWALKPPRPREWYAESYCKTSQPLPVHFILNCLWHGWI
jgi:hypothetical protein